MDLIIGHDKPGSIYHLIINLGYQMVGNNGTAKLRNVFSRIWWYCNYKMGVLTIGLVDIVGIVSIYINRIYVHHETPFFCTRRCNACKYSIGRGGGKIKKAR